MDDHSRERFRRADGIFDAVLDLPPDERDAYVVNACGTDEALLHRVRVLLTAHERSTGFLQSPAVELAAALLEEPSVPVAPDRVGPYRIVRELGHGGMGVVYLAEREGAEFEQRVALKLVRHFGATEAVLRRFVEERRILALLQHERIAHLIDGGLTSTGLPYFAMEVVEGEPIDTYCNRHGLTIAQRVDLFIEVCEAVQYAHEHLVIHRDLKPSNILIRADGQLKLLDFGLAKLLDPLRDIEAGATETAVLALTPEYAAPEQVRGQPVSTATDTYSLGVLLYLLLGGRRPYDVRGRSPAEIERIVCDVEPARLSSVAPEKSRRALQGDLDLIVTKALNKDPARRYSSASGLRDDLRRFRAGLPILARPDSRAYRVRKFIRRNRTIVAAAGVTSVALIAATVFSATQMRVAQQQRDVAVQEAERQRALTDVQAVLAGDSRDAEGRRLSAAQRIALAEQVLHRQYGAKPRLVVEGLIDLATRLYEMGERGPERAMLERASVIARNAKLSPQLAIVECSRAYSLAFDDQLDSARAALSASRAVLAEGDGSVDVATAACLDAEGFVLTAEGKPDSGIAALSRAVELTQGDNDRMLHLEAMVDLSVALRAAGRTREAAEDVRKVLADLEAAGYRGTVMVTNVMSGLTGALYELGELVAVDSAVRASLHAEALLPGTHSSAFLNFTVGLVGLRLGALDTAEVWLTRALRDTTEDAGGLSAYLPPAMTQLRIEQGRLAEARRSLADLPTGTLTRRVNRAWFTARVVYGEGDTLRAITMLDDSLRVLRGDARKPPPSLAMPLVTAAEWRLARGDARAADSLAVLAREAAAVDSLTLERSAYVGRAELIRAKAWRALGDESRARLNAERAIIALANGYGATNKHTVEARSVRDALLR